MSGPDITIVNLNLMLAVLDGSVEFQICEPLGPLYVTACLEREGFTVDFRDYQIFVKNFRHDPFNLDHFAGFLKGSARIVGFSCMSNLLPFALLAAKRLKEEDPNRIVILGGAGPTGVGHEIISNFDWVDYVCSGEGDRSIIGLMTALARQPVADRNPIHCPGFVARRNGKAAFTPHPRILDLDALPFPAHNLLDFQEYDAVFSVITSRGCVYRCTFCTETNHWNNRVVFRSVERVVEEVKLASALSGMKLFAFQDAQLTGNRERAVRLFHRLRDEGPQLHWKCFARVDSIDDELLHLMAESGCVQVRFGIESGNNDVLKEMNKGFTIEQAYCAVCSALKHIQRVDATFIWGFPFETVSQCRETAKWIVRFRQAGCGVQGYLLSPLPNSAIFQGYQGPLDFNERMITNFNCSGGENLTPSGTGILQNALHIFELVRRYPRIFPGFYVYDFKNNVEPKQRMLREESGVL